jgi:hypothetical protein
MRIHRNNTRGQKLCGHPRCSVVIARRFLMCLQHWHAVPMPLRLQIWAALKAWENDPGNGVKLNTLNALQAEAIRLVS